MTHSLLVARIGLADAIVTAARGNVADARERGDRGLLAGCEAALEQRIADAARLRAELKALDADAAVGAERSLVGAMDRAEAAIAAGVPAAALLEAQAIRHGRA